MASLYLMMRLDKTGPIPWIGNKSDAEAVFKFDWWVAGIWSWSFGLSGVLIWLRVSFWGLEVLDEFTSVRRLGTSREICYRVSKSKDQNNSTDKPKTSKIKIPFCWCNDQAKRDFFICRWFSWDAPLWSRPNIFLIPAVLWGKATVNQSYWGIPMPKSSRQKTWSQRPRWLLHQWQ